MAQNKSKQLARLQGKGKRKAQQTQNLDEQNHHTISGNTPGQRNRIGTRKTGMAPRFK